MYTEVEIELVGKTGEVTLPSGEVLRLPAKVRLSPGDEISILTDIVDNHHEAFFYKWETGNKISLQRTKSCWVNIAAAPPEIVEIHLEEHENIHTVLAEIKEYSSFSALVSIVVTGPIVRPVLEYLEASPFNKFITVFNCSVEDLKEFSKIKSLYGMYVTHSERLELIDIPNGFADLKNFSIGYCRNLKFIKSLGNNARLESLALSFCPVESLSIVSISPNLIDVDLYWCGKKITLEKLKSQVMNKSCICKICGQNGTQIA